MTMDAGIAEALVHLREARSVMVAFWAHAGEAVDAVGTSAAIVTWVAGTFIDVDVTHCP